MGSFAGNVGISHDEWLRIDPIINRPRNQQAKAVRIDIAQREEMLGRQLTHLSRAEEQGLQAVEIPEDLPRQLHCGVGHRHGVLSDPCLAAHLPGHAHGFFEEPMQQRIDRSAPLRREK